MSELLYGRHAVLEALRADRRQLYRLWVEGDANQQTGGIVGEILAAAKRSNLPVRYLQGGMFDKFRNEQTNAQGVALETGDYPYVEWEDCLALRQAAPGTAVAADPGPPAGPAEPGHADPHGGGHGGARHPAARSPCRRA